MKYSSRIVGRYEGKLPGPLLLCIGAMHGNEPAGIQAIEIILQLLNNEPTVNPGFVFSGRVVGLVGNMRALREGKRFISQDLNRILTQENVDHAFSTESALLTDEEKEMCELIQTIRQEIDEYKPGKVIVLDIHSTSASGGIFVITSDNPESVLIGKELHAPVILDFVHEIDGTTLGYFTSENFSTPMVTVVFECGQHQEVLSVNRAIAAIINCMRTIGCINAHDVENKHDLILMEYSRGLPKIARLIERYAVDTNQPFVLTKEFRNFEPISTDTIIAYSGSEPVRSRYNGLILMPRLQDQGDDGFFVVSAIEY